MIDQHVDNLGIDTIIGKNYREEHIRYHTN